MTFRIFSPTEVKTAAEERVARDSARAKNVAETARELYAMRDEAERLFTDTLEKQQNEWERIRKEKEQKKTELDAEIAVLEERKRVSLMPIIEREKAVQSKEADILEKERALESRRSSLEEEARLLMRRLDELATLEQDIDARNDRSKSMSAGAQLQAKQIAESARAHALVLAEFEKKIVEQNALLTSRKAALDAQEKMNEEKITMFEKREKEISDANIVLADRRMVLEQGFEELRNLKQSHGN